MIGPTIEIIRSCYDCEYQLSVSYEIQSDSGYRVYCTHPNVDKKYIGDTTWFTPDWCPVLMEKNDGTRTEEVLSTE